MNTQLGTLQIILLIWLLIKASALKSSAVVHLCPVTYCGNVTIRYPFGTEKGCYFDDWYEVTCNSSDGSPKPFLRSINLEVKEISSSWPTVNVNVPVVSSGCSAAKDSSAVTVDLSGSPFSFTNLYNRFTVIGCDNHATMIDQNNSIFGGCVTLCSGDYQDEKQGCYGVRCCQASIPPYLKYFKANISNFTVENTSQACKSAFIVDQEWFGSFYLESSEALIDKQQVPARLDWGINNGRCFERSDNSNTICSAEKNGCWIPLSSIHLCRCTSIDQGYCRGDMICMKDNCSHCPVGYYSSQGSCYRTDDGIYPKPPIKVKIIIGCICGGFGMLFLLIGAWWLYKFVKRRREIKLQQKFFKRNGGLLLQQELSSTRGNVDRTKLFASKELEKATDNYNANRILGKGGQGTVYKGMLVDGRIVAVKKSKIVDESKVEEFINEVVILSQINHRNVVKLLGCCLEMEVPLLVYEFIPNGTLFQYLHDQTEEFPITWEMRMRIAVEVSDALSYLHSAASIPIYHRDIKSANILLDDKYRAKVSDFGTSRSMTVDQTHLTTQVHGTFGYLDPEYFRSSHFTEKSDVYSFGVVLAELLTGQKPIRSTNSEDDVSLAAYFLCAMKEDRLFEVLDPRVIKEGGKEEIAMVARLAKRCLNLNGKKRPTMKEVATELMGIRASSNQVSILPPNFEEMTDYEDGHVVGNNLETGSSSTGTGSIFSTDIVTTISLDVDPLISNRCK